MPAEVVLIAGALGAGKTSTLARIAVERANDGDVFVICSHESSCRAFERALAADSGPRPAIVVATLPEHLARFMRADYASARVAPSLVLGGTSAAAVVVGRAARGLLDLSWPELGDGSIDLDLPLARRPGALLEEATSLFELLRRSRVDAAEFEAGCRAGLFAFYGDDIERARELLRDVQRTGRGSRRARAAMLADTADLRVQRRAERDLATVLAHLYRAYIDEAGRTPVKSESEVIGSALDWLKSDWAAAARVFGSCSAVLVDDAEDGEPALEELLTIASAAGVPFLAVAGREESAIDELHGRRACAPLLPTRELTVGPPAVPPIPEVRTFADEEEEADWIARRVAACVDSGSRPEDIAILTRDRDAARAYGRLLAARGLPALAPPDSYEAPADIGDLLALARVVDDPYDQARLLRVLASPLVGFSDASLWALCGDASAAAQLQLDVGIGDQQRGRDRGAARTLLTENVLYGAADGALPEFPRDVLRKFRSRFAVWRAESAARTPTEAFRLLVRTSGFAARWRLEPPYIATRRADDAARIAEAIEVAVSTGVATGLSEAIEAVECGLIDPRNASRVPGALVLDGIVDVKGEYFTHVIVAGVARERFPRVYVSRALAFSRKYGLVVRENVADGAAQTAKFAWYYTKFDAKRRYLEGERRALRYGLSRGISSSAATGFGAPPRWAKDEDLLADLLAARA